MKLPTLPDSRALLHGMPQGIWVVLCAIALNSNAQNGLKVGLSAGYAVQEAEIPKSLANPALQVLPGNNAYAGLELRFPLSEDAELRTGFRLRNQSTLVSWSSPGSYSKQQDELSVVELPLGFGLKRNLGQRWTIRQIYALELQVLGSGTTPGPIPAVGPVFQVLSQPSKHLQAALSVQAELGYCTSSNFCLDLQASYHQGFTGTQQIATAVLRSPDQNLAYPLMQSGSYFSTGLAISLPAGRLGRKPDFNAGSQL